MEQIDLSVLYFFNVTIASDVLDAAMKFVTNIRHWIPVYILASVYLVWKHKWRGVRVVVGVAILAGVADAVTNMYIKEVFARPRPCALDANGLPLIDWLRLPDGARGGYSLPSSHAVNNFAAAMFFGLLFPSLRNATMFFLVALVIALTRPYLGVHYPSDILAGMLLGIAMGYLFAKALIMIESKFFSKPKFEEPLFTTKT